MNEYDKYLQKNGQELITLLIFCNANDRFMIKVVSADQFDSLAKKKKNTFLYLGLIFEEKLEAPLRIALELKFLLG